MSPIRGLLLRAVLAALAGGAAVLGLALGVLALVKERHVAVEITAAVGVAASAVLGVVALVFAPSEGVACAVPQA